MPERYQPSIALPKIYVINLLDQTGRRQFMDAQLSKLGLEYEFVDGVPGPLLMNEELDELYDKERAEKQGKKGGLLKSEIGCALSHIKIYKEIADSNADLAIVMEDDALIGLQFLRAVEGIVKNIDKSQPEVVLLHHVKRYFVRGKKVSELHKAHPIVAAAYASAYIVNKSAAKSLAENLSPVWFVADKWNKFVKEGFVKVSAIVPYVVGHSSLSYESVLLDERSARRRKERQQEGYKEPEIASRFNRKLIRIFAFLRGHRRQPQTW